MPAPQTVELEASQSLPVPPACLCVLCCANRAVTSFQLCQLSWISLLHRPWAGNRARGTRPTPAEVETCTAQGKLAPDFSSF